MNIKEILSIDPDSVFYIQTLDDDICLNICKSNQTFSIDKKETFEEIQWIMYRHFERNDFSIKYPKKEFILLNNKIIFRVKHNGARIHSALFFDDTGKLIGGKSAYSFDVGCKTIKLTEIISEIIYAGF